MAKMKDIGQIDLNEGADFFDAGQISFLGRNICRDVTSDDVDMFVVGVPFDICTTLRPGARFGPRAIRAASENLSWEGKRYPWDFSLWEELRLFDGGDVMFFHESCSQMESRLENVATQILAHKKQLVTLGGDHYATLPLLRAHAKALGPVAIVHFDAHTDMDDEINRYHHGTPILHALTEGWIDSKRSVQVGVRTEYSLEKHPFTVLDAAWCNAQGPDKVAEIIHRQVGTGPTYLSFDIDVLDPAFAPGTGTPVIGGFSTDFVLKLIRRLIGINLVGMDMMEVSPIYDHSEITALAAATIVTESLHVWVATQKGYSVPKPESRKI